MEHVLVEFDAVLLDLEQRIGQERKPQRIAGTADNCIRLYRASIREAYLLPLQLCNAGLHLYSAGLDALQEISAGREPRAPEIERGQRQSLRLQLTGRDSHPPVFKQQQAREEE
jgi:hypothetical protein